jgi:uncharacterized protein YecT (DUF1311 family)
MLVPNASAQLIEQTRLLFCYCLWHALFHVYLMLYECTVIVPRRDAMRFAGGQTNLHNGSWSCITARAVLLNEQLNLMLMKFLPAIFVLVSALANAASSCENAVSDPDLRACASKEFTAADKRLNDVYSKLNKLLDPEGQRKLREAQRAWIKYRDANAEFSGDINRGGSAEILNHWR